MAGPILHFQKQTWVFKNYYFYKIGNISVTLGRTKILHHSLESCFQGQFNSIDGYLQKKSPNNLLKFCQNFQISPKYQGTLLTLHPNYEYYTNNKGIHDWASLTISLWLFYYHLSLPAVVHIHKLHTNKINPYLPQLSY